MPPQSTNRPPIERWNRAELEDHYFRLYDEHDELKKQYNIQQDNLKKMAKKVVQTMSGKSKKDIEDEDADNKIADLERQVMFLQNKSTARSRRIDPSARASPDRRSQSSMLVQRQTDRDHKIVQVVSSSVDHRRFDSTIMELRRQIDIAESEAAVLRDKLETREIDMEEERVRLKSQLTSDQRAAIQENIEVIRLQRQVKEKSTEVAQTQAKFIALEKDLRTLKKQHDNLLTEFDQMNTRLRTEQNKNAQMAAEIHTSMSHSGGAAFQITQELDNLKRENAVLKETNDQLIANAFDATKDVQWAQNDRSMRARMAELESAIKADVNTRNEIFEKLGQEIASREQAETQFRKVEVQMLQLKAENERMEKRLNNLMDGMAWVDVEQAIAVYKQQKDTTTMLSTANTRPDFLLSMDKEAGTARDELDRLRLLLAESVEELEKTRNMLIVQHRINTDFQAEVQTLNQRTDTYKREYESKLKEYAQLLDQRTARIQRLESQLRDIAYGRRPVKIAPEDMDEPTDSEIQLEAGQNLLEIKLTKLTLTELGLKWMSASQPTVFLTIEFFDFEIQFTPMIQGPESVLDFTAEYTVLVSDLFIYYLQTDSAVIELHQAIGTNYKTWGAGAVFMRELLSAANGRLFGRVSFVGTASEAIGTDFGQLEYSIHLKVPLERALNMYKERALALGFVTQDGPIETRPETEQTNQLLVIIHRSAGLKANHPAIAAPSPYVMYQVFDFPHHSTAVNQANMNPEFGDQHVWTLPIGPELDQYLRSKSLRLVVFDDAAPNDEMSYLGHVEIPLLPLSHNKPITGTFSLKMREQEKSVGTIDVSISWKFVYVPPKESLFVAQPLLDLEPEKLIEMPRGDPIDDVPLPIRRIAERKPILPVPKGTSPRVLEIADVTGTVTVAQVHDQTPERDLSSVSIPNQSPKTSTPTAPLADSDELEAFKSKPRLHRDDSFTVTKAEPEVPAKSPLIREDSFTIKKAESDDSEEDVPQKLPAAPHSVLGILPPMPPAYQRSSENASGSGLPALGPVAPPRKRGVEFSEPLHESIPPSESQSLESNQGDSSDGGDPNQPSSSKRDTSEPGDAEEDDGARVAMRVLTLRLVEDSPLLDRDYNNIKAFVEWKFLDLPQDECETPASLPLPRHLGQSIDYDCYKNVPLNERRIALLKQWATLDTKMEFTLVSDPGDAGDCDDLGVAQLSLQSVLHDNQQTLTFYNVDGFPIAELDIDVHYSDSLVRAFAQA